MSDQPFEIRRFELRDVPKAIELSNETGLSAWDPADLAAELKRPRSPLFAALEGEHLVGFIIGRLVPGRHQHELDAEIYNIGVTPLRQGRGVGKSLLNKFCQACRSEGVSAVWLEVRASNRRAREFYGAYGFAEIVTRRSYYSGPADDAVVMHLILSPEPG